MWNPSAWLSRSLATLQGGRTQGNIHNRPHGAVSNNRCRAEPRYPLCRLSLARPYPLSQHTSYTSSTSIDSGPRD